MNLGKNSMFLKMGKMVTAVLVVLAMFAGMVPAGAAVDRSEDAYDCFSGASETMNASSCNGLVLLNSSYAKSVTEVISDSLSAAKEKGSQWLDQARDKGGKLVDDVKEKAPDAIDRAKKAGSGFIATSRAGLEELQSMIASWNAEQQAEFWAWVEAQMASGSGVYTQNLQINDAAGEPLSEIDLAFDMLHEHLNAAPAATLSDYDSSRSNLEPIGTIGDPAVNPLVYYDPLDMIEVQRERLNPGEIYFVPTNGDCVSSYVCRQDWLRDVMDLIFLCVEFTDDRDAISEILEQPIFYYEPDSYWEPDYSTVAVEAMDVVGIAPDGIPIVMEGEVLSEDEIFDGVSPKAESPNHEAALADEQATIGAAASDSGNSHGATDSITESEGTRGVEEDDLVVSEVLPVNVIRRNGDTYTKRILWMEFEATKDGELTTVGLVRFYSVITIVCFAMIALVCIAHFLAKRRRRSH